MAESINGLYKPELIYNERFGPWRTVEDVELATLSWVHRWNHQRLLEPIGNIPPVEFEQHWADANGAAAPDDTPSADTAAAGMIQPWKPPSDDQPVGLNTN